MKTPISFLKIWTTEPKWLRLVILLPLPNQTTNLILSTITSFFFLFYHGSVCIHSCLFHQINFPNWQFGNQTLSLRFEQCYKDLSLVAQMFFFFFLFIYKKHEGVRQLIGAINSRVGVSKAKEWTNLQCYLAGHPAVLWENRLHLTHAMQVEPNPHWAMLLTFLISF